MRIVAWNVNHRTRVKPIPSTLWLAVGSLGPDVVVLTEYVAGPSHQDLLDGLRAFGLAHSVVSRRVNHHNRVLMASRHEIEPVRWRVPAITPATPSNVLRVRSGGFELVGLRAPMFQRAGDRDKFWSWWRRRATVLSERPAVVIGDLNTAPNRQRCSGAACLRELSASGWSIPEPEGPWSYRSHQGKGSKLDYVLASPRVEVSSARYVTQSGSFEFAGSASALSDHAALVADVRLTS